MPEGGVPEGGVSVGVIRCRTASDRSFNPCEDTGTTAVAERSCEEERRGATMFVVGKLADLGDDSTGIESSEVCFCLSAIAGEPTPGIKDVRHSAVART